MVERFENQIHLPTIAKSKCGILSKRCFINAAVNFRSEDRDEQPCCDFGWHREIGNAVANAMVMEYRRSS